MQRFLRDEQGATAIEYAMICLFIVLVMIIGLLVLSKNVGNSYNNTATKVGAALNGASD